MAKPELQIRTRNIYEISCSFCATCLREDVKERDEFDNQKYHFRVKAVNNGWATKKTEDGAILNLCQRHARIFKDEEDLGVD